MRARLATLARSPAFWLVIIASCILTPRSYEIGPPNEYHTWWKEVETCLNAKGDLSQARWSLDRSNDGRHFPCGRWVSCVGLWIGPNRVILAARFVRHEGIVKHEMAHAILQGGDHDSPEFKRCTGMW